MPPCEHGLQRPQQTRPYQLRRESNTMLPRIWSRKTRNWAFGGDTKQSFCRRLWPWTTGYFDSFHGPTAAFSRGGSTFLRLNPKRSSQRAPRRHSEADTGIRLTKPAAPGPDDAMEDAAGGSGVRRHLPPRQCDAHHLPRLRGHKCSNSNSIIHPRSDNTSKYSDTVYRSR